MLTHKASRSTLPATGARPSDDTNIVCYFGGQFVPLAEARIPVMTHGFLYGTATFEGIRAYWNEEHEQLYGLKLKEHYRRMHQSAKVLLMKPPHSVEELVEITVDLLRRNGFRQDTYVRPTLYKSTEAIGVRLHNLEEALVIFAVPFGEYIAIDRGITAQTVSWRRNSDQALPARSKITGAYANSAFSKSEAVMNGYDEAIVLTVDGHVSEGSAENLFIVREGKLITPAVTDDILEGITRHGLMQLARQEMGIETITRTIDRSELYIADEVFLCGTGAQISPVVEIDHRPVGAGEVGPIARQLAQLYFDVVRGRIPAY
ncbi:MAG: branched-chain amino acid transaminase, partial [Chloroflexota bacterium]|nr:branched-chain amino acid transaminase [Chloroflexota bacterium]